MIPLFKVFMSSQAKDWVNKTLYSGFIGEGPMVKEFEGLLSEWLLTERVLALNSATSGLELSAYLMRNKSIDWASRVHTTSLTCSATNWPLMHTGLDIDWIDVDPATLNMDLDDLRSRLNWASVGVVLTHWAGRAHDMDAIAQIQCDFKEEHGRPLIIVEDCAHAFCGFYKGQALGTFGDFGVYSFQAVKPLTTGDGGCLISKNPEDHKRAKLLRWYGIDRDDREADIMEAGFKYHMNDLAASLGIANIIEAHDNVKAAIANAREYHLALTEVPGLTMTPLPDDRVEHPWWLFTVFVERRDDFIRAMKARGIETSPAHKRNDKYKCAAYFSRRSLPNLDSIETKYVNIPVGWWLTPEDRGHVIDSIKKGW
jgi:dTDP-4-amino-4,6-dideoxygalactose transaminase